MPSALTRCKAGARPVLVAIACVTAVTLPAFAPPCCAETMSGALVRAYSANPDLNQERDGARATDEGLPRAEAVGRPTVTGTGQFGYNYLDLTTPTTGAVGGGIPVPSSTRTRAGTDVGILSLKATQNLFNGNRTRNGVRQAESNIFGARESLRNTEQDVLLNAATAYMNVLCDTAILDLLKNNVTALEEQLRQSRDRFNLSEVTRTDVAQTESSLASGRADYAAAQSNLQISVADYQQVIGVKPTRLQPARPIETLLPRTLRAVVAMALAEHPAIQSALHATDAAALQVKLVEGELAPTLNVVGTIEQDYNEFGIPRERLFNGFIGGQVSVPIYEGGEVYARVREAKERFSQARHRADQQADSVRDSAMSAWSRLESARTRIQQYEAAAKAAEIALDGVRKEAEIGQRTTFDILLQQQMLINARVSLVSAQRDRVVASYAVMAAIGRLSAASLNLSVARYNPTVHFDQVKDKWIGLDTPGGG